LRRFIIIGVTAAALAAVAGASVAVAAAGLNKYTAKITFKSSKAGTKSKPVPVGFTENYGAANLTAGLVGRR